MTSSLPPHGHQYPSVIVHDNAYVHQGDVYHQNIVLENRKIEVENKSFGLCLGDAPLISPDAFKGRQDDLKKLRECLLPTDRSGPGLIVSIVGTGGLGKTQLSLAYARAHAHEYSSVFWLNASDEISLRQDLASLARIVFSDSVNQSYHTTRGEEIAIARVRRWLSQPANDKWLLILDNYDNPHFSKTQPSTTNGFNVRPFLPMRSQGSIIITTRSTKIFFSQQLQLREIRDVSTSISILSQRSHRDLSTDPQASDLAQRLGGLPLALATAGTFLASTTMSCAEYRHLYESKWTDLFGLLTGELSEYPQKTLSTTWTISLEHVRAHDEEAAKLLEFLAFLSPRDIWYELLKAGASVKIPWLESLTCSQIRFQQAMTKLCECCLIDNVAGSYQIHPCLHDWLKGNLDVLSQRSLFVAAITCVSEGINIVFPSQAATQNRRLLDHIEHLESSQLLVAWNAYCDDERVYGAAGRLASLQRDYGFFPRAETMYRLAWKGKDRALGPTNLSTLTTMHDLSFLYIHQQKLDMAEQIMEWIMAKMLQTGGLSRELSLETSAHRSTQFWEQDSIEMLQQISAQLLRGREEASGSDIVQFVFRLANTLGAMYRKQGKSVEAARIWAWLLVEYEKAFGSDTLNLLLLSINLSVALEAQGKFSMAEDHLKKALARAEHAYGSEDYGTLMVVKCLGGVYEREGELGKAEQMLARAFAGLEALLGPEHRRTLETVESLGIVYIQQRKYSKAEQMLTKALMERQKILGQESIHVLRTMLSMGWLYRVQDRLQEAEQMLLQALAGYEKIFGPEHINILEPLKGLRDLYATQRNWSVAKQFERRISSIEEANGVPAFSLLKYCRKWMTKLTTRHKAASDQQHELDTLETAAAAADDETARLITGSAA